MTYADAQIAKIQELMEKRPWDVERLSRRLRRWQNRKAMN